MSKLEVDKIDPQSGTDLELGSSGDTVTIPTGVTLDASNATTTLPANVVTTDGTQTLTNKTIDASQLSGTITPSDGTVTNAKIVDSTIELAKLSATGTKDATTFLRGDNTFDVPPLGGITEADQWRLSATHSGLGTLTSNWERNDSSGFGYLGTGMSESSGIFTFPSTGYWNIFFFANSYIVNGASAYTRGSIEATINNSSYEKKSNFYNSHYDQLTYETGGTNFIFDVTDTSQCKVRFAMTQNASNTPNFQGDTTQNYTAATFIRLGDT